jgi:mitochondrial fission protein ELM1
VTAAFPGLERIVLTALPGAVRSSKPPVRIFLGTESAQYRAERVFLWSIEQVRDPGRSYEIVLMRDLPGFDRRRWTTSFTNYRFAVPHLAGGEGRAIYNDEDQIYLSDPGELFDLDLDGHGYLSVSDSDTSVMLLDCARMAEVWPLKATQHEKKRALLDRARAVKGLYGVLAPEWNARDDEYEEGRTRLLHYTTLHTQPWRPFPERFVYHGNPHEGLWFRLEEAANRAGFQVFTRERPTQGFARTLAGARQDPRAQVSAAVSAPDAASEERDAAVRRLVERTEARTLLEIVPGCGGETKLDAARFGGESLTRLGLARAIELDSGASSADGVLCLSGLDSLSPEDTPWVVEELFRHARGVVFAAVACDLRPPARRRRGPPVGSLGTPRWWVSLFQQAAARRPEIHWEIGIRGDSEIPGRSLTFRSGGSFPAGEPPRVWILTDGRPGHTTQSLGLAEELGWPYERRDLAFNRLSELPNALLDARCVGLRRRDSAALEPPWPDLVIACGRRLAPIARWIRAQSRGRSRIVQLGRKGTNPPEHFDLSVVPAYAQLLPHPHRIETAAPVTLVRRAALEQASLRWKSLLDSAPAPRIALLVGGGSPRYAFSPEVARRLGGDVMELARKLGGSVFATTSRRTSREAGDALARALEGARHIHLWRADQSEEENPYLGYLALADVLVVTGESASMLAEACGTGKPVYIYPLPERTRSPKLAVVEAFTDAVFQRAHARPTNRRGTTRPQKRLEHLCSRLLASGAVRPVPDLELLHRTLIELGAARRFGDSFEAAPAPHSETAAVAQRVRQILGAA